MRIAVLGWGSLVWDPKQLKVQGDFEPSGPPLSIEFSRISANGRLTLVIDERNGTVCQTSYAVSAAESLDDARENLCVRESMTHANGVGFVNCETGAISARANERHPAAVPVILDWARTHGFDAVIWTALAPNFSAERNAEYTTAAAVAYISDLASDRFALAAEYIRKAPKAVQTPFRTAFSEKWPES